MIRRSARGAVIVLLLAGFGVVLSAAPAAAAPGSLTQDPGSEGCIALGLSGCGPTSGGSFRGPSEIAISPDGNHAYIAASEADGLALFDRDPATGDLIQKPGTDGCITQNNPDGFCTDGVALDAPEGVAVSPDGENVYVASAASGAVAVFDRDAATGALTQKPGTDGCVSDSGNDGACADGNALSGASSVVVSPDGDSVYVAAVVSHAVTVFDRDPATGALTQKAGTEGCLSFGGTGGTCRSGNALFGAWTVAVAPDGANVYVASSQAHGLAVFDRDAATGALTQKAGTEGCITDTGTAGTCTAGHALEHTTWVTVSPDGANVYVGSDAIVVLDRDTTTGALTQKAGTDGCLSGTDGTCTLVPDLGRVHTIQISPDGDHAYADRLEGVSLLDRDPTTGALTPRAGPDGCLTETGDGGACGDGHALERTGTVTIAPDGANVYTTARTRDTVAILDRQAPGDPTVTITTPPGGATYDVGEVVDADFECSDDDAVVTCAGDVAPGSPIATTPGEHRFTVTATDDEGNTTTITHAYSVAGATCAGRVVDVYLALGDEPTTGDDVILGTDGPDTLRGLGGDDVICGLGGDDTLGGGPGRDIVLGGPGSDTLWAGGGGGRLAGNRGGDRLEGGGGHDGLWGGPGRDHLVGRRGNDTGRGGPGRDTCRLAPGRDTPIGCEIVVR